MANSEFYTSNEFKSVAEYKEYKAEIYAKPKEIKNDASEFAQTGPETQFGQGEYKKKAKSNEQKAENARSKLKRFFDSIKNSTAKVVGTVSATVVVAASAIIVTSNVFNPPEPPIIEQPQYTYTASINFASASDPIVEWGEETNVITLNSVFEPSEDENCLYRISLLDSGGEAIADITDSVSDVSFEIPSTVQSVDVMFEELYKNEKGELVVLDTVISEYRINLSAPKITFLDEIILHNQHYYLIPYIIESEMSEYEEYESLEFIFVTQGYNESVRTIVVNNQTYIGVEMPSEPMEFTVAAALTVKGAYGGYERPISAQKVYKLEPELLVTDAYLDFSNNVNQIVINFKYIASEDSYLIIRDNLSGEQQELELTTNYEMDAENASYDISCLLVSAEGETLKQIDGIKFRTDVSGSYDNFNYVNPGDIVATFNPDGTMNLYAHIEFETSDPNVYYELILNGDDNMVYKFTDSFMKIEDLPLGNYYLVYRICTDDENGMKYILDKVSVSGGVELSITASLGITEEGLRVDIYELYDEQEEFTVTINEYEIITFEKSELVYNEELDIYTYLVPYDGKISSASLGVYTKRDSAQYQYEQIISKYGQESIKGDVYVLYVII